MSLQDLDKDWDNKIISYDTTKYDLAGWALKTAKTKFPQIDKLETVHQLLNPKEISELGAYMQKAASEEEFLNLVDGYYSEIVPKRIPEGKEWMIQRVFTIRIVIPNQEVANRLLGFHQGVWVGNGLGLRTIWTPLTNCYGSNSMQIASWKDSDYLTNVIYTMQPDYQTIQEYCLKYARPVNLPIGCAHLFQQHHIHGNVNNETDITRWSVDGRILIKGGHYHRKLPGGYFRFLYERDDIREVDTEKEWITYAGWNTKFSNPIPLPMQRDVINKYCNKYDIKINDYQFENEYLDWLPGLEHYIRNSNGGIICCSIYCLPDDRFRRTELLELAVDNNVEIHFANENCRVITQADIDHIERIFSFVNENTDPNITLGTKP